MNGERERALEHEDVRIALALPELIQSGQIGLVRHKGPPAIGCKSLMRQLLQLKLCYPRVTNKLIAYGGVVGVDDAGKVMLDGVCEVHKHTLSEFARIRVQRERQPTLFDAV